MPELNLASYSYANTPSPWPMSTNWTLNHPTARREVLTTSLKLPPLKGYRGPIQPVALPSLCDLFGTMTVSPASVTYRPYTNNVPSATTTEPGNSPSIPTAVNMSYYNKHKKTQRIKTATPASPAISSSPAALPIHSIRRSETRSIKASNFIVIVGQEIKKRHRKRYHEVTRSYRCVHPGCNKAYGALNHLNAHLLALDHGPRRRAKEYKPPSTTKYSSTASPPPGTAIISSSFPSRSSSSSLFEKLSGV